MATATNPLSFGGIPLVPGQTTGSRTSYASDPFSQFLQMYMKKGLGNLGNTDALDYQFNKISQPLLDQLKPQEGREVSSLNDLFRLSGAQQSGAYATSARQLIGDQGSRRNQMLASNYVPLINALTTRDLGGINAATGALAGGGKEQVNVGPPGPTGAVTPTVGNQYTWGQPTNIQPGQAGMWPWM